MKECEIEFAFENEVLCVRINEVFECMFERDITDETLELLMDAYNLPAEDIWSNGVNVMYYVTCSNAKKVVNMCRPVNDFQRWFSRTVNLAKRIKHDECTKLYYTYTY